MKMRKQNRIEKTRGFYKVYFNNRPDDVFIKIDKDDLDKVIDGNGVWTASTVTGGFTYAYRMVKDENGKRKPQYLHRVIMGVTAKEDVIDHLNWDTLDCRKFNMRITTLSGNCNRRRPAGVFTEYMGLSYDPKSNLYFPNTIVDGMRYRVRGGIKDEYLAAQIYNYLVATNAVPGTKYINPVRKITDTQLAKLVFHTVVFKQASNG